MNPIAVGVSCAPEDPRQQLPVTACPAVLARRGGRIVRRKLIEELDIGDQSCPCEDAFKEVVTQQRVLRYSPGEGCLKCIDIVDPFADVRALTEKVLVNIGDRRCVRVNAARAREDALKKRSPAIGRQRRRHARLKQGVALNDSTDMRVKPRPIEGMRYGADQSSGGPPWQPRVGIQCDDIADAGRNRRCPTGCWHEAGIRGTAQQAIEFMELAPFALPADPLSLALVPAAPAVEKKKSLAPI